MYVKPCSGLRIVDPVLRDRLPPGGREVTPSPYWSRRVRDGDVIVVVNIVPAPDAATGAAEVTNYGNGSHE